MVANRPADYKEKSDNNIYGPFPIAAEEVESAKSAFYLLHDREATHQELADFMTENRPALDILPKDLLEHGGLNVPVPPEKIKEYTEKYEKGFGYTPSPKELQEYMNRQGDNFIPVHTMGLPLPDGVSHDQLIRAEDSLRYANGGREPTH